MDSVVLNAIFKWTKMEWKNCHAVIWNAAEESDLGTSLLFASD